MDRRENGTLHSHRHSFSIQTASSTSIHLSNDNLRAPFDSIEHPHRRSMPLDAPSPTPSAVGIKRPRPSATVLSAGPSRTKRRKPEDGGDDDGGRSRQPVNFGVGMVKGKEDEWGEPADVTTKVGAVSLQACDVCPGAMLSFRSTSTHYQTRRCIGTSSTTTCSLGGTRRLGPRILALRVCLARLPAKPTCDRALLIRSKCTLHSCSTTTKRTHRT